MFLSEFSPEISCVLDYFGILFILDLNSVLREFILWDQRLYKGFFCENSEELRYC